MTNTVEFYRSLVGQVVRIGAHVADDTDSYPEKGMLARVREVKLYDEGDDYAYVGVKLDYTDFEEHNRQFESASYFDGHGNPICTAHEAGMYEPVETVYLNVGNDRDYFCLANQNAGLFERFQQERQEGQTYTMWLEAQLLAMTEAAQNARGLLDTPIARRRFGDNPIYTETVDQLRTVLNQRDDVTEVAS